MRKKEDPTFGEVLHEIGESNQDIHRSAFRLSLSPKGSSPLLVGEMNEKVQGWIRRYTEASRRASFEQSLQRGIPYKHSIQAILRKYKLPQELYYLPVVESDFRPGARSPMGAVGLWQLAPMTGVQFGLMLGRHEDQRRDPLLSTHAAARYLSYLHNQFRSWDLALAAYNAGEKTVRDAIQSCQSRDFWVLVRRGLLPTETAHFVPKFLAVVVLAENPEKYGLEI